MRLAFFPITLLPALCLLACATATPLVNSKSELQIGTSLQLICSVDKDGTALELPYVYGAGGLATCLPADVVRFSVCVEGLGLEGGGGTFEEISTRRLDADAPKTEPTPKTPAQPEQRAVTTKLVEHGAVDEARARALDRCTEFLGATPKA